MQQFIGQSVIVRTVTFIYTGRLVAAQDGILLLEDAAWVADSGRWAGALRTGQLDEVEPYPDGPVAVSAGAMVDVALWAHPLPRVTR